MHKNNNIKSKFFDLIKNLEKEDIKKLENYIDNLTIKITDSLDNVLEGINKFIPNRKISSAKFKELYNIVEEEKEKLTLEYCISILKKNFDPNIHVSACIYKNPTTKYQKEINLFFLDKNNMPLINGESIRWIIYANRIESNLKDQFGDDDMIILK